MSHNIIERLRFYADSFYGLPGRPQLLRLTEGQAELLAVDIRKVCNELERVTSIAEVARMKEEMMRAQRERDRADDRAEHWHGQYEALKQENLDLWTELEIARRIIRESGTTYPYKAKTFGGDTHLYNTAKPSEET